MKRFPMRKIKIICCIGCVATYVAKSSISSRDNKFNDHNSNSLQCQQNIFHSLRNRSVLFVQLNPLFGNRAFCLWDQFSDRSDWTKNAKRWNWGFNEKKNLWMNWHNIQKITPTTHFFPQNNDDVIKIFKDAEINKTKVKVVGAGCSPNTMALCDNMIFTDKFSKVIYIDASRKLVRAQSGITFKDLCAELSKHKMDLSILTSISEQSLGGALACAIHNTGKDFGCLSTFVESLQIIAPSGEILECSENENPDIFKAALCHLGALGFISEITLRIEPEFKLRSIQNPISLEDVLSDLKGNLRNNEHYKFWWFPHTDMCLQSKANRVDVIEPNTNTGDFVASQSLFLNLMLESLLLISRFLPFLNHHINRLCRRVIFNHDTEVVDYSENVFNFDCLFRQYVNEWAIPEDKCEDAMHQLQDLLQKNPSWGVNFPVEVRFSKGDDIWLSPAYGRNTCWIGIIMYRPWNFEPPSFWRDYFQEFEKIMKRLDGRPHWAKENRIVCHEFKKMYPKFDEWLAIRKKLDPNDILVNDFIKRIIQS